MKTLLFFLRLQIRCILLAVFTLVSAIGHAQTYAGQKSLHDSPVKFRVVVFPGAKSTVRVAFENYTKRPVRIRFVNQHRTVLHEEMASDQAYHRRFNVQDLRDGNYAVIVTVGREQFVQPFRVGWSMAEQTVAITPSLTMQDNGLVANY